jgi:phage gp45-like
MHERLTLSHLTNQVRLGSGRATVREFNDDTLMQECKYADVLHSETPSDFERWQMVGLSSYPLKQDQDQKQQNSKQGSQQNTGDEGDWNHDQPKGKASEALMLYVGGARGHPVALCDDRRVRPLKMPEGATALYAASGTGQMFYHNDAGSYVVAVNNPKYDNSGGGASGGGSVSGANVSFRAAGGSNQQQTERFASLRHVNKKPQDRSGSSSSSNGGGGSAGAPARDASSGGSSGQSQSYQHEGESVNTEIRCTSSRIEFRVGDNVVGYYDTQGSKWSFTGEMHLGQDSANHPSYGVSGGVGMTTVTSGVGAVLVNATKPGPPTSEDNMPLSELESKLTQRINDLEARLAKLEP